LTIGTGCQKECGLVWRGVAVIVDKISCERGRGVGSWRCWRKFVRDLGYYELAESAFALLNYAGGICFYEGGEFYLVAIPIEQ
jgi:hypothetical protein